MSYSTFFHFRPHWPSHGGVVPCYRPVCYCSLFFYFISQCGQYGFNLDWFHSHIENDCWKWIWWTLNFGRNNQGNNHSRCWTYSWNEGFHSRNHIWPYGMVHSLWFIGYKSKDMVTLPSIRIVQNPESSFPNGVIFQDNFKFNTVSNSSCDCLCKTMDFAVWAIIVKGCSCSLTFNSLFSKWSVLNPFKSFVNDSYRINISFHRCCDNLQKNWSSEPIWLNSL